MHEASERDPIDNVRLDETVETPDAGEPAPILDLSPNGTTHCDRETGSMVTTINNTRCTRTCTEAHEADHRAYRRACCSTYAAARRAAIAAGDLERRNAISRRYNAWVRATSNFSECRAYTVSVECAERKHQAEDCDTPTDANRTCCADLATYRAGTTRRRDAHCPGVDQACPDFSA